MTKARDIADFKFENIVDTGTTGTKVATGTTAQRGSTTGQFRFNSTTGLAEYYDGTDFRSIDSPPSVSSVNTSNFESSALPTNIVITGSNFASAITVKFIGNDGTETSAGTTTRDSATQITAQIPNTITSANEPYNVKVTNSSSNLSNTLANAFNIDAAPAFSVASGSLGTILSGASGSGLTQVTASDDEGDSITFSISSGSIPAGLTFNSNGSFSGNASNVGTNTVSTFTVQASDGTNTSTRQYTAQVNAPTYVQLSGSGTWSVPSGVTSAEILIVAGGGSGGRSPNVASGGGGGGGIVHTSSYTFTSTDISNGIAYVVGDGGTGVGMNGVQDDESNATEGVGQYGHDTTFAISGGTITAKGGGYAGGYDASSYRPARQGGSGGGGSWDQLSGASSNQATFSGWTSYGNSGGNFVNSGGGNALNGAGGGGAGGAGANMNNAGSGGNGGVGQLFSNFTSYGASGYFGGGGGGGNDSNANASSGGNGGGGNGGHTGSKSGSNGTATTGGGGGGASSDGYNNFTYKGGNGGSGTILIKY
tara:strand:- start:176 stop:1786 length:1611 start_codon:yes stop_codon:yes gene_type:complete